MTKLQYFCLTAYSIDTYISILFTSPLEIENQDFFGDQTNRFDFGLGDAVGVEFMAK